MDIERVDPRMREATRKSTTFDLENRFILTLGGSLSRFIPGRRVSGVERRIVRDLAARIRVYVPAAPTGSALLWLHGGGLVMGSAAYDDVFCGETARDTGAIVVSVDYRLAPKFKFPVALDDCAAGYAWMLEHADELGIDTQRIAVGGQSAGAGLAASLVQRLHDEGAHLAAQWLFCPMLDDRTAADRSRDDADHFIWNNRANLVGWRSYLGDHVGSGSVSGYAAAARRDDLSGLPATWIYGSDIELFYDEIDDYARRLERAGVDVTYDLVPGVPHGFEAWAPENSLARELVARARSWLAQVLTAR